MAVGQKAAAEVKDTAVATGLDAIIAQKVPQEAKIIFFTEKSGRWLNDIPNSILGCCLNMYE